MNTKIETISYKNHSLGLHYFIRPGDTKTLLYLHGGACSQEDFFEATTRKELQAYTLVAFDFPGCGDTPYPEHEKLDIDDLVTITHSLIHHLKLHNITLIGHSMGGLVALKYIVQYGGIDGFVSIEGNLAPENCVFSRKVAAIKNFDKYKNTTWPELQKSLKNSCNKGFQQWAKAQEKASDKAFYDYCHWIVKNCDDPNTLNEYLTLPIPRLYIYGSENRETLPLLKKLEANGSKTKEISHSNHFPFYDNPEDFYTAVAKFIASL